MGVGVTWFVLIVGGLAAALWGAVFLPAGQAVSLAAGVVAAWLVFGNVLAYVQGFGRRIRGHLGPRWADGQVVTHVVRTSERVDLQHALDEAAGRSKVPRPAFGFSPFLSRGGLIGIAARNPRPVPIEWESYSQSLTKTTACATNAVYLLDLGAKPFALMVRPRDKSSRQQVEVEVLANTRDAARAALDGLLAYARSHSVYRGRVVSLERSEDARLARALVDVGS